MAPSERRGAQQDLPEKTMSQSELKPVLGGPASKAALVLTMFVEAIGYGMVAPTLPFMGRATGASEGQIGILVGLYAVPGLLLAMPIGALANRLGRRRIILSGLAALALASIGFIVAPSYYWLVVARLAQGLGAAGIWVGSMTVAGDLSHDENMGRSLSWLTGAWSAGFLIGPVIGGIGSLRFPFILYAALAGVAFLFVLLSLPETLRAGPRTTLSGILRVLLRRPVLLSAASTFTLAFYWGAFEAFAPLLMVENGVRRSGIGILFAVAAVPSIFLPGLMGRATDRFGDVRLIIVGLVYAALLIAIFLPLLPIIPLWLLFLLLGAVDVAVYIPTMALLNRGLPIAERAFATGSHTYAFSAGFFLGPTIGGALMPLGSYPFLFGLLTAVTLACAGLFMAAGARSTARA
jgi:MFS family permease